jgi:hypothetical protein
MKLMHCVKTFGLSAGLVLLTGASAFATSYDFAANGATAAGAPTLFDQVSPGSVYDPTGGYAADGITFTGGAIFSSGYTADLVTTPNVYITDDTLTLKDGSTLPGVITGTLASPTSDLSVYLTSSYATANTATVTAYDGSTVLGTQSIALDGLVGNLGDAGRLGTASFTDPTITKFTVSDSNPASEIALYAPAPVPEVSTSVAFGVGIALMAGFAVFGRKKNAQGSAL